LGRASSSCGWPASSRATVGFAPAWISRVRSTGEAQDAATERRASAVALHLKPATREHLALPLRRHVLDLLVAQALDQRVGALAAQDLLRLRAEVLHQRDPLDDHVDAAPAFGKLAHAVVHLRVAAPAVDHGHHRDVALRLEARALDGDLLVAEVVERVPV